MRDTEHHEQVMLFKWARMVERNHPELALLFAIPNGGLRAGRTAAKLKAEGVKPGVPDLCLPVARGQFGSLWIELKTPETATSRKGTVSAHQAAWHNSLNNHGQRAVVCFGFDEAKGVILDYLERAL